MSEKLGPIDVCCDAPPYNIVQACAQLGFRTPEDVRWCRMSHYLDEQSNWRELLKIQSWRTLFSTTQAEKCSCTCGQKLASIERYTFVLSSGKELSYLLTQCLRCRSIFWESV